MERLLVIVLVFLFFAAIGAAIVYACWNYLFTGATSIIGVALPEIGFLQSFALAVMCQYLFKGSGSSSN